MLLTCVQPQHTVRPSESHSHHPEMRMLILLPSSLHHVENWNKRGDRLVYTPKMVCPIPGVMGSISPSPWQFFPSLCWSFLLPSLSACQGPFLRSLDWVVRQRLPGSVRECVCTHFIKSDVLGDCHFQAVLWDEMQVWRTWSIFPARTSTCFAAQSCFLSFGRVGAPDPQRHSGIGLGHCGGGTRLGQDGGLPN